MEGYLTTILLCIAILLIATGIHTDNIIITSIGGVLAGGYNAMIQTRLKEK